MIFEKKKENIKNAVMNVFNISSSELISWSREEHYIYARMIYTKRLIDIGYPTQLIVKEVGRDRTTLIHYMRKYDEYKKYIAEFREYDKEVENILKDEERG